MQCGEPWAVLHVLATAQISTAAHCDARGTNTTTSSADRSSRVVLGLESVLDGAAKRRASAGVGRGDLPQEQKAVPSRGRPTSLSR